MLHAGSPLAVWAPRTPSMSHPGSDPLGKGPDSSADPVWQDADDEAGEAGLEADDDDDDDDGDDEEDGDGDKEDEEEDEDEQKEAPKRQKVGLQLTHAENSPMVACVLEVTGTCSPAQDKASGSQQPVAKRRKTKGAGDGDEVCLAAFVHAFSAPGRGNCFNDLGSGAQGILFCLQEESEVEYVKGLSGTAHPCCCAGS